MKNTPYAGLAIRVALFYFTVAGVCQNIQAQSEVHFRLVHDTLIVASLMAGEEGPFEFVLDTGADTTIVDPSIAPKLSLVPLDRVQQTTLAGVQTLTRGSIHTLSAGPVHVENLPVLVQDLTELRKLDSHIEGIAGQDFLSHFNYLLDYRRHSIRIELASEIRDLMQGDRVPMETSENRMIVESEAQSPGRAKLRLLLDSGANSLVLIHTASSQAVNLPTEERGLEVTSSGQIGLNVGRVHALTVGSEQFHDIAVALPAAEPAERIGDGLLPTALFQALYVNNRESFVVFNPRVKKN
jgi:predicted aspartyl protease